MSSCLNKDFLKKYAIKCELIDNKIKCPSKNKLKNLCPKCSYFHIVKCHKKYYALPCMYPCGENTGMYVMCPSTASQSKKKCYKYISTHSY